MTSGRQARSLPPSPSRRSICFSMRLSSNGGGAFSCAMTISWKLRSRPTFAAPISTRKMFGALATLSKADQSG